MIDLMKKTFFTTIGVVYLTKEKLQEVGKKYIEEANLSEEEGKKFFDELLKKSAEARAGLEKVIHEKIDIVLKKLNMPTREEFIALEKRIAQLEDKAE